MENTNKGFMPTRAIKKALAVLMTFVMVLSCWVFAPEMFLKAEAVNAGSYKIVVTMNNTDDMADWESRSFTVYYKPDNGTGTETSASLGFTDDNGYDIFTKKGVHTITKTVSGFPTSVKIVCNPYWNRGLSLTMQSITINGTSVYSGSETYTSGGLGGKETSWSKAWTTRPTPTKITWSSADTTDLTLSSTATVSRTFKFNIIDQFGVVMGTTALSNLSKTPTVSVSGSKAGTISTTTSNNIYYSYSTSATDANALTVYAKTAAHLTDADEQTMTITVSCNSITDTKTKTFKLKDESYTYTMDGNNGSVSASSPSVTRQYYNKYDYVPSASRTGFSPIGFYTTKFADSYETNLTSGTPLSKDTIMTSNLTWYAAWQANKWTATFNYRDSSYNSISEDLEFYYGKNIVPPTIPQTINVGESVYEGTTYYDYTYTFSGWKPTSITSTTTMPNSNVTYTADYSETPHYADYTALDGQIAIAERIKTDTSSQAGGNNFYNEGGYTDASKAAFDTALTNANALSRTKLKSQQTEVDGIAAALESAIANLTLKQYTVMFVDEEGAIIKDGLYTVNHGDHITVPTAPEKSSNSNYHYNFDAWSEDAATMQSQLSYITDTYTYVAQFTAQAHTWKTTTVDSTCTSNGVLQNTCTVCGYYYTTANPDDLAHHTWSTEKVVVTPATCISEGVKAYKCENCGVLDNDSIEGITKLNHSWSTWNVLVEATCTDDGVKVRHCTNEGCTAQQYETISATNHTWEESYTTDFPATCTTKGQESIHCQNCDAVKPNSAKDIDVLGHNFPDNYVIDYDAQCETPGLKHKECTRCSLKDKYEVISAKGHSWGEWNEDVAPTCCSEGSQSRECSACHTGESAVIPVIPHVFDTEWTIDRKPDCVNTGLKSYHCSNPLCTAVDDETEIPALGHHMVKDNAGSQTATCTLSGYDKMVCDNDIDGQPCGYTEYTNMIDPLGHSYVVATPDFASLKTYGTAAHEGDADYFTYTPADCTHAAYWTLTCKRDDCGNTVVVRDEDHGATQHTWESAENDGWVVGTAATCTTDGSETRTCSVCSYSATRDIPKLGHNWGEWVITTPATNDADGVMTRTCSRGCTETAVIPAGGGHVYDMEKPIEVTPATCHSEGVQKFPCKIHENCDAYITAAIPMTPHDIKVKSEPETCTENGYVLTYCSCWTEEQIAAYFENGTPGQCSFEPVLTETYATGHSYDYEHGVTTDPTCTEDGKTVYTCTRCEEGTEGHTTTVTIPKLGHNYAECNDANYTPATCMNGGYWSCECSRCDDVNIVRNESDPSTGHVWIVNSDTDSDGWKVTTQPTCTIDGEKARTCKYACGTTETATVPALGHNFDDTIEGNVTTTAPTCTSEGEKTVKCSRCDVTETTTLSVLGHDWIVALENRTPAYLSTFTPAAEDAAYIRYVDATCAHGGYWELICKRDDCGAVYTVTNYENDPASNVPHTWNTSAEGADADGWVTDIEATCVATGEKHRDCTVCNLHETAVIDALGHAYNGGEVTTAPTCTEAGVMTYTCMRCDEGTEGHTYTEEISALGHDFDDTIEGNVTTVAPTCITDGTKTVKCSRCYEKETTPLYATGVHEFDEGTEYGATCIAYGYTLYKCIADENCTYSYKVTNEAQTPLGHEFEEKWTLDVHPTCTTNGSQSRHCIRCEEKIDVVVVGKIGHNFTEWEIEQPSTCTERGVRVRHCTNTNPLTGLPCDYKETDSMSYLPHQWSTVYTQDDAPTCTKEGSKSVHCTVCGNKKAGSTVSIPRLPHNYDTSAVVGGGTDPNGAYSWVTYKCVTCDSLVVRPTFYAISPSGSKLSGAVITVTSYPGGTILAKGETDSTGAYTPEIILEPRLNSSDIETGNYCVDIKYPTKNYVGSGILTVKEGNITGNINTDGKLVTGPCECSCHKDNLIGKLKRWIYSFFSLLFKRTIKCCEDMQWHPSFKDKLK